MDFLRLLAAKLDPDDVNIPSTSADSAIGGVLGAFYIVAGVTAVIVLISAGYMMTTSRGNADQVAKARRLIMYSVAGIIIILSAFTITQFVIGRL